MIRIAQPLLSTDGQRALEQYIPRVAQRDVLLCELVLVLLSAMCHVLSENHFQVDVDWLMIGVKRPVETIGRFLTARCATRGQNQL